MRKKLRFPFCFKINHETIWKMDFLGILFSKKFQVSLSSRLFQDQSWNNMENGLSKNFSFCLRNSRLVHFPDCFKINHGTSWKMKQSQNPITTKFPIKFHFPYRSTHQSDITSSPHHYSLGSTVKIDVERLHHPLADIEIGARIKLIAQLAQRNHHVAVRLVRNNVDAMHHLILDEALFDLISRNVVAVHAGGHLHLLLKPRAGRRWRRRRRLHGSRRLTAVHVLTVVRALVGSRSCLRLLKLKCCHRRHRPWSGGIRSR